MNKWKLLQKAWVKPKNLRFAELVALAEAFGFRLTRRSDSHAKPYQIRQFLLLVEQYNLGLGEPS